MTMAIPRGLKRSFGITRLVEAMATPHALDRYLELVDPMVTVRDLRAEVTDVHRTTSDSITVTLRPTRQWAGFEAGQFVQVGVVIDGVRHTRCYSPCDSQHRADGRIELTVKAHPGGLVSGHLHEHARVGLVVDLSQAAGTFRLPNPRPADVLLISGGSGITPVLSMLRTLVDEGFAGRITFLHYANAESDVAQLAELRSLAAAHGNVELTLAYTESGDGDLHGFFGPEHLAAAAPWHASAQTYLCGPPGLMTSVAALYDELGLADQLHREEFTPTVIVPEGTAGGTLAFTASSAEAENSGATILEQAEASGLTPEYGCRMGICFSCTAVKRSGCTKNLLTGELESDPDQPIQLCVNVPVGDVAIEI
ncbi:ferredoxin reductase [Tomitella biformata]|uniref:ferredoxin reductase n=1 Tax=Tomitella biformata TaxID=630403 RepID=UPI0004648B44|nr:FAD-binding oxidoreductase [Tomitella biformata]